MSLCYHATFELLGSSAGSHEDDRGGLGHEAVEFQQRLVLVVVFVNIDVKLLDAFDSQIFVGKSKNISLWREAIGV